MEIIGVTGNSGSGKTLVCSMLRPYGAYIIDADKIARQVTETGMPAYDELTDAFGAAILYADGTINRRQLADIAFADKTQQQRLIDITHKYIVAQMYQTIESIKKNPEAYQFIVLDAPLLIEAGLHKAVTEVWVTEADEAIKIKRIMARDAVTEAQAVARLRAQPCAEMLSAYASRIIINQGDMQSLSAQVRAAVEQFLAHCQC